MKKTIFASGFKLGLLVFFLGNSVAVNAQLQATCMNQNQVNFSIANLSSSLETNAVSLPAPVGTSNGVDTYKTYTVTIPFFDNSLTGTLQLRTNTFCDYPTSSGVPDTYGTINVNGVSYPSHTYTIPSGLSLGHHFYTVKSYCGGSQLCNTQLIDINVVKEAIPSVSLNIAGYCKKNSSNLYSGYIGFNVTGSYVNAAKLYLRATNPSNYCPQADTKLTLLSNDSSLPTNSLPATGNSFYDCQSATTYTVKLVYRNTSVNGDLIEEILPSGSYGWTEYVYVKKVYSCLNPVEHDPVKLKSAATIFPNPVKEILNVKLSEDEKILSVSVLDFSNTIQKRTFFKGSSSEQSIEVANLKKGIYLLEIVTDKGMTREKFVKE